jgi:hypothetical protein
VMTHGVAHTPVPVNTDRSNQPGTACAPTRTVFSQKVLLGRRTTLFVTIPLSSYPRSAPVCAVTITDLRPSNNFRIPCTHLGLSFHVRISARTICKSFREKSCRQERPFLSFTLSRRPPVGPNAVLTAALDGRAKIPSIECQMAMVESPAALYQRQFIPVQNCSGCVGTKAELDGLAKSLISCSWSHSVFQPLTWWLHRVLKHDAFTVIPRFLTVRTSRNFQIRGVTPVTRVLLSDPQ